MGGWIKRTFQTISSIIDQLVEDNKDQADTIIRVALVGYRDVKDKGRFMEYEFSQDIEAVKGWLDTFEPRSMEQMTDRPEDVAGGFKLALMQDWTEEAIKRCVLICDAPAHGYFESPYMNQDNYPNGTPDVPSLEKLVDEFKRKDIALQICKLDMNMDKMINEMKSWWSEIDIIDVM